MENATKALLISAGVLIVIVLVAIGISLLNSASSTTDSAAGTTELLSSATEDSLDVLSGYQTYKLGDKVINRTILFNSQFQSNIELIYNTEYIITMKYEVVENSNNNVLSLGIGFGNRKNTQDPTGTYLIDIKDIPYSTYNTGAKGTIQYSFVWNTNNSKYNELKEKGPVYIWLRPASPSNNCKVNCYDIKIKTKSINK